MIDENEVNRFVAPDNLWNLHEDARATLVEFQPTPNGGCFVGRHSGYERLSEPVIITREIALDGESLSIVDLITGAGHHQISMPLHFAPGVEIQPHQNETWVVVAKEGKTCRLSFTSDAAFEAIIEDVRMSPSYGVALPTKRLVWRTATSLPIRVRISIAPSASIDF
jgi:hypothetical protein